LSKISEKSSTAEDSQSDWGEGEEEEAEDDTEGGYGWAVVFASFLCIAVIDGVGYTTGKKIFSIVSFFKLHILVCNGCLEPLKKRID
jgi:hypothetical protein